MPGVIQKWSAKTRPMQMRQFVAALGRLNALYRKIGRRPWSRACHELYGGHAVAMEREFRSVAELDRDEKAAVDPRVRRAKKRLLETVLPGSVELTHHQLVDL